MGRPVPYSSLAELPVEAADFQVYVGDIYHGEMYTNYLSTICVMVRRREAGDALHFTDKSKVFEDWECFGRLARRGLAAYLDFEAAVNYAHPGSRLTDANLFTCAEARLVVLKTVWGSDADFLEKHGEEYRALVRQQQLQKVRGLLVLGRPREAREEIRNLTDVPVVYQALSRLPSRWVTSLLGLRRALNDRLLPATKLREEQAA